MLEDAIRTLRRMRGVRQLDSSDYLFSPQDTNWGDDHHQLNDRAISKSMAAIPGDTDTKSDADVSAVANFIKNSSLKDTVIPVIMSRKRTIPGSIPLLDILRGHLTKEDTWKIPAAETLSTWSDNRGFSKHMDFDVEMRHIVMGFTPNDETDAIRKWVKEKFNDSELLNPIGVLPISLKTVPMSTHDIIRLTKNKSNSKQLVLEDSLGEPSDDEKHLFVDTAGKSIPNRWSRLPAHLAIGDGISWLLIVSSNITCKNGKVSVSLRPPQQALLELLHELPPLTGRSVKKDVSVFESVFSLLTGVRVSLPFFIQQEPLAVLAGWTMPKISPGALSLLVLGTPAYTIYPPCSRRWAYSLLDLPEELQLLVLGENKMAYLIYSVLLLALREEVIPDPDIWCYLTGELSGHVLSWWADFVAATLRSTFIHEDAYLAANSRQSFMASIRGLSPEGHLLGAPPYRVRLFIQMVEGGATVTRGGPRFLHVERERALQVYTIAATQTLSDWESLFRQEVTEEKVLYARFDQYSIPALDRKLPVPSGSEKKFLTFHPRLPYREVVLSFDDLTIQYMLDLFKDLRRSQSEGILEWGRLNIELISDFFQRCLDSPCFRRKFRALYDPLRMMVLRVMNEHTITLPACEESLKQSQLDALQAMDTEIDAINLKITDLNGKRNAVMLERNRLELAMNKGALVDRSEWRKPHHPVREAQDSDDGVQTRLGAKPTSALEINRRGVPPQERARDHRFRVAADLPERGVPLEGSSTKWLDGDEDPSDGRLPIKSPRKRSAEGDPDADAAGASGAKN